MLIRLLVLGLFCFFPVATAIADVCIDCHKGLNPVIVSDWRLSRHAKNGIGCGDCHGAMHKSAADSGQALIPTPDTCNRCHPKRVAQFKKGKHALAWAAMNAMPIAHMQPMALVQGKKGCGGCHKIGMKSPQEIKELEKGGFRFGVASCDVCHTRHTFSVAEARQPQACRICHEGLEYSQWDTYTNSKHGTRYLLKQAKALPAAYSAPTCQTCHMPGGDHGVRNAWGSTFLRMPMPEDKEWAGDRATILQAFGILDPDLKPTPMLEGIKALDIVRMSQDAWQKERDRMVKSCTQCHSANFARGELAKGDRMVRDTDRLMAEGIRTVAALYKDGILRQGEGNPFPFPNILAFNEARTPIELKLSAMFFESRLYAIQGTFHGSPAFAYTKGWSKMRGELTEINAMAAELRRGFRQEK
jgi:hydroxylamine dehydrogenase